MAARSSAGSARKLTPPASRSAGGSCQSSPIWKTGNRPGSRARRSASTTRANGRAWWSRAACVAARTRPSSAVNAGSPDRSARTGSGPARAPMSPASSG